jgi:hypothetical protein
VPAAVADYLAAQNLPSRFAMAPHEEMAAIPWEDRPLLEVESAVPIRRTAWACSTATPASPRRAR